MAGPVPPRAPAEVKAGLLDLVGHASERGWAAPGGRVPGPGSCAVLALGGSP